VVREKILLTAEDSFSFFWHKADTSTPIAEQNAVWSAVSFSGERDWIPFVEGWEDMIA